MTLWWLAVAALLSACGGGGSGQSTNGGGAATGNAPEMTTAELQLITDTQDGIGKQLFGEESTARETSIESAREWAVSQQNVEGAEVLGGALVVKYRGAGFHVWPNPEPADAPPADLVDLEALTRRVLARQSRVAVGTRRAALINALAEDPDRQLRLPVFDDMERILKAAGFNVVLRLDGAAATRDALRQLGDCGLVVQSGHGGPSEGWTGAGRPFAVQTGERWDWETGLPFADWFANRVVPMTVPWGPKVNGEQPTRTFYGVTGRFWSNEYRGHQFTRALFMNCACSGAAEAYSGYREELEEIGVVEYTGWTGEQGKAVYTAWRLLATMADGKSLQRAVDELPDWYKSQTDPDSNQVASFWYGPEEYHTITLGGVAQPAPDIVITSPLPGEVVTDRRCMVEGMVSPTPRTGQCTLAVNGQSTHLPLDTNGFFSQPVGLHAGINTIRVTTFAPVAHSASVSVDAEFTPDILFTTLWWNTDHNDVDLHLIPVSGGADASEDCYWNHMRTSWGATLDVDDIDGFGPEHTTARSVPPGEYQLSVHYYDTHGQTEPPAVNVAVSTNGGQAVIYSLPALHAVGDWWRVCNMRYPEGTITPLNAYVPASLARVFVPAKPPLALIIFPTLPTAHSDVVGRRTVGR